MLLEQKIMSSHRISWKSPFIYEAIGDSKIQTSEKKIWLFNVDCIWASCEEVPSKFLLSVWITRPYGISLKNRRWKLSQESIDLPEHENVNLFIYLLRSIRQRTRSDRRKNWAGECKNDEYMRNKKMRKKEERCRETRNAYAAPSTRDI